MRGDAIEPKYSNVFSGYWRWDRILASGFVNADGLKALHVFLQRNEDLFIIPIQLGCHRRSETR